MNNFISYSSAMSQAYNGLHPIDAEGITNFNQYYQSRYLYNKIYSKFDFKLPKDWDLNTFRFWLFRWGSIAVFKKGDEIFFSPYSVESLNRYLNPYECRAYSYSNDLNYDNVKGINGKTCQIIKCFDDFLGWEDLVRDTAESLADIDKAIKVATMNANVNLVAFAENAKEAEEIKTQYANATQGTPLVITNAKFAKLFRELGLNSLLQPFTNHDTVSSLDKLLVARRTIVNNFLTDIGIKNANISKKERLNEQEVEANDEEVSAVVTIAFENLKECFEKVNEIFGIGIEVDLKNDYEEKDELVVVEGGETNV